MEFELQHQMDVLLKATAAAQNAALPLAKWKEDILKQAAETEQVTPAPVVQKRGFRQYLPYACTAAALVLVIGLGATGLFSPKYAAEAAPAAEAPAAAPAAYAAGAADMAAAEAAPVMEEAIEETEEAALESAMEAPAAIRILPDGTMEEEAKEEDLPAPAPEAGLNAGSTASEHHDPKRAALYAVMDALAMDQVPPAKVLTISEPVPFSDIVWTVNDHQPYEVTATVHMVTLDDTAIASPIYIVDSETYEVYGYLHGA